MAEEKKQKGIWNYIPTGIKGISREDVMYRIIDTINNHKLYYRKWLEGGNWVPNFFSFLEEWMALYKTTKHWIDPSEDLEEFFDDMFKRGGIRARINKKEGTAKIDHNHINQLLDEHIRKLKQNGIYDITVKAIKPGESWRPL